MSVSFKIQIRESVIFRVIGQQLFLAKLFCDDHLVDIIKLDHDACEQPIPFISGQLLHLGLILPEIIVELVVYTHEEDPVVMLIPELSDTIIKPKHDNAVLEQTFICGKERKKLIYKQGTVKVVPAV